MEFEINEKKYRITQDVKGWFDVEEFDGYNWQVLFSSTYAENALRILAEQIEYVRFAHKHAGGV